jgi:hypothetical protein
MKTETINPDYAIGKNPLSVIPEMLFDLCFMQAIGYDCTMVAL